MLYFNRIDVSDRVDVNKTSGSKECDVCHYWYFLNCSVKFQPNACNRCHDLIMMSLNLSDIAILNIKGSDYRCIISLISKKEVINLMQNADLTEKNENLIPHIKMGKEILMFGDIEIEKKKFYRNKILDFEGM